MKRTNKTGVILKLECIRMLNTPAFFASVAIGIGISIWHIADRVWDRYQTLGTIYHGYMIYPNTVFNSCLSGDALGMQRNIFLLCVPILATIPYAASAYRERMSGYAGQIFSRISRKKYGIAKYLAVFLSGFLAVCVPVVFDFMGTLLFMPLIHPEITTFTDMVGEAAFFGNLYYAHPMVYTGIIYLIASTFGGLCAVLALGAGRFLRSSFAVLVFPFIINMLWNYMTNLKGIAEWQFMTYMSLLQPVYHMAAWKAGVLLLGLFAAGILLNTLPFQGKDAL